jgi:hypothetical protein
MKVPTKGPGHADEGSDDNPSWILARHNEFGDDSNDQTEDDLADQVQHRLLPQGNAELVKTTDARQDYQG